MKGQRRNVMQVECELRKDCLRIDWMLPLDFKQHFLYNIKAHDWGKNVFFCMYYTTYYYTSKIGNKVSRGLLLTSGSSQSFLSIIISFIGSILHYERRYPAPFVRDVSLATDAGGWSISLTSLRERPPSLPTLVPLSCILTHPPTPVGDANEACASRSRGKS